MPDLRRALGRSAEEAAAVFLAKRGLAVVARNVRFAEGEIDLVCQEGPTWVFVEVKSRRAGWGDPAAAAVTQDKQRRLVRLARHYLKWRRLGSPPCRFDVVAVAAAPDGHVAEIRHLRDAFGAGPW